MTFRSQLKRLQDKAKDGKCWHACLGIGAWPRGGKRWPAVDVHIHCTCVLLNIEGHEQAVGKACTCIYIGHVLSCHGN